MAAHPASDDRLAHRPLLTRDDRWFAGAGVYWLMAFLTSLPFLFASFLPSTDLPQHLAQIRLAADVLAGRAPELYITWAAPNNLVYVPLAVLYVVLPVGWAARIGLWALALAWALSSTWLARRRGRSPAAGVIVGLLAFQAGLYWGFLNFLLGWPLFVAWLTLVQAPARGEITRRRALLLGLLALGLYGAHLLWFAVAALWALVEGIQSRPPAREWALRAACLVPGAVLAARWYPTLAASRALFPTSAVWISMPWQRLTPAGLAGLAMGGLAGPWPIATGAALLLWCAAAVATRWRELPRESDGTLLRAAALLGLVALLAPDGYMNTILFAQRWGPCAVALLVIGLPAPRLPGPARIATALLAAASVATSVAWRSFDSVEMTGFAEALAAARPAARLLEMDTIATSQFLGDGRPFMQMMAYLQAKNGGILNFSFAEHGSALVAYREPRRPPWTPGIEWHPERATTQDLLQFDTLLINATPEMHARIAGQGPVTPLTSDGRWRLYEVRRP